MKTLWYACQQEALRGRLALKPDRACAAEERDAAMSRPSRPSMP